TFEATRPDGVQRGRPHADPLVASNGFELLGWGERSRSFVQPVQQSWVPSQLSIGCQHAVAEFEVSRTELVGQYLQQWVMFGAPLEVRLAQQQRRSASSKPLKEIHFVCHSPLLDRPRTLQGGERLRLLVSRVGSAS